MGEALPDPLVVMALEVESQGLFEREGVPVLFTGLGKVNATFALTRRLAEYRCAGQRLPQVINFGTAGSRRFPTGTADSFETGDPARLTDVVDMEAYALAKVCWRERVRFACVKFVTDGADHAAASSWQGNLPTAAAEFLRLYRTLIDPRD